MKAQPNGVRLPEVSKVLSAYGYQLERQKGSHRTYDNNGKILCIPCHGEGKILKSIYRKSVRDRERGRQPR